MDSSVRFHRLSLWFKVGFAAAFLLALLPTSSRAELFTANGSGGDGALSATADFEFAKGVVTITLTNTLDPSLIRAPGQALSDIIFTLSNSPGTQGTLTAAGQFGNIDSNGSVTYVSQNSNGDKTPLRWLGEGPSPPNGQGTFSIQGDQITMEALGGGKPSEMILPYVADGGSYTNSNKGFQKNFSSYVIGSATFTLDLSGVTSGTTVDVNSVQFSFGTGPDTILSGQFVPGGGSPGGNSVPAPPSVVLLGFGGLGLAFVLARSRRRLAMA